MSDMEDFLVNRLGMAMFSAGSISIILNMYSVISLFQLSIIIWSSAIAVTMFEICKIIYQNIKGS